MNKTVFSIIILLFMTTILSAQIIAMPDINIIKQIDSISAEKEKLSKKEIAEFEDLANGLMYEKRFLPARQIYLLLLKQNNPKKKEFLYFMQLGAIEAAFNDSQNAIKYYESAQSLYKKNLDPMFKAGDILLETGLFDFAQEKFKAALKINKKSVYAKKRLGDIFFIQERFSQALEYYKMIDQRDMDSQVFINMLICYKKLKQSEEALNLISANQAFYSINAQAHFIIGEIYLEKESYEEAKKEFLMSVERDDTNPFPYLYLASLSLRENDLNEAKTFLSKANSLNQDLSSIDFLYAQIYYKERNLNEAKKYAQQAVKKAMNTKPFIAQQAQRLIDLIDKK